MHAYLIIAHDQFDLLESLLKCIDDERNDIYIHIDSHSKLDISRIQSVLQNSRVEFVPRIHIRWGGFDMVRCCLCPGPRHAGAGPRGHGFCLLPAGRPQSAGHLRLVVGPHLHQGAVRQLVQLPYVFIYPD